MPKNRDRYADLKRDLDEATGLRPPPKPKAKPKPTPPWVQRRRFRKVNPMPTNCRQEGCGAELNWCINEDTRKRIPLDVAPNPEGRWVKVRVEYSEPNQQGSKYKIVRRLAKDEDPPPGHGTYTSHFETCTNPQRFSKGRTK